MNKNVQRLVNDLESMLSSFYKEGKSQAVDITEDARKQILDTIGQIQNQVGIVQDKALDITHDIETKTKENPWSMLLGAASLGLIAGLLIRRD